VIKRLEARIEELTSQVNQSSKDTSRLNRTADKNTRDAVVQLAESDRQRARLEEELKSYESRVQSMRQTMDEMVRNNSFSAHLLIELTANKRE
jgi:myosin protein heavy chain